MTQQPKLTEKYVHSVIDDAFGKLRRIGERYNNGYLTRDEWFVRMLDCYNDAYSTLFTDNRLELRLDEKSYSQFVRDHEEYTSNHGISLGSDHVPWLYDISEGEREAASPDQEYFLYFMDRFSVSPDFLEPPPEGMAVPVRRQIHQYRTDCVYGIDFRCVDDGGLLSDDAPVGKTFTLKSDMGLKAVLTVREDRRHTVRKGMDFDEVVYSTGDGMQVLMADLLAEGCIEGYTAEERGEHPEVLIRTGNRGENICWLAYWSSPEDEKAYRDFPLWHEYFLWCTDRRIRQERLLHRLFMTLSS